MTNRKDEALRMDENMVPYIQSGDNVRVVIENEKGQRLEARGKFLKHLGGKFQMIGYFTDDKSQRIDLHTINTDTGTPMKVSFYRTKFFGRENQQLKSMLKSLRGY